MYSIFVFYQILDPFFEYTDTNKSLMVKSRLIELAWKKDVLL